MALTVGVDVSARDRAQLESWLRSPSLQAGLAQRAPPPRLGVTHWSSRLLCLLALGTGTFAHVLQQVVRVRGGCTAHSGGRPRKNLAAFARSSSGLLIETP